MLFWPNGKYDSGALNELIQFWESMTYLPSSHLIYNVGLDYKYNKKKCI